ncbi:MAG: crossover junction endodeoxyribonuclease RuvC [Victivallaceae bacterium]
MVILGIDPAIRVSGYAVIQVSAGGDMSILDCGMIKNRPNIPHSECLRRISCGVNELLSSFKVDAAAIEEPFVSRNAQTALILGMARGAFVTTLACANIPTYSYMPRKAKLAAVGSGSASKEQVASLMAAMFKIQLGDIPLDATDALAIAFCHGQLAVRESGALLLSKPI